VGKTFSTVKLNQLELDFLLTSDVSTCF